MPSPRRCPASHTVPSVRKAKDPETGKILQVRVPCQGVEGHDGPHFNGHDAKGAPSGLWE